MRSIGTLSDAAQARLFHDYLFAQGIRNEVERDGDAAWLIWVADEEQLDQASGMLERFRQNPGSPEFAREAASAGQIRAREAKEYAEYRKRFFTSRQVFPGSRSFGAGVLTYGLIVVCILVALFSHFGESGELLRYLFIVDPEGNGTGFLPEVRTGEVWRLFTPVLIHFGIVHLLFNMMWLFELGSMIESRKGHLYFALLTVALAVGSNVAQYAVHGPEFGGMSGVIYGLFGYVWIRGKLDPSSGLYMDRRNVVLMMVWLVLCTTGWIGPIANVAHGAGLVLGAGYGLVSALVARGRHR